MSDEQRLVQDAFLAVDEELRQQAVLAEDEELIVISTEKTSRTNDRIIQSGIITSGLGSEEGPYIVCLN